MNVSNQVVVEMGGQGGGVGSGSVCRSLARAAAGDVGQSSARCVGVHTQTVLAAGGRQQELVLMDFTWFQVIYLFQIQPAAEGMD